MVKQLLKIIQVLRRLYWRIARPETRGVRAILTGSDGNILLVWHKYQEGWFLPGGKVSRHESDEDALRRELQEELGVEVLSKLEKLGEYTNTYEYKKDIVVVFVVRGFTQKRKKHFEIEDQQTFNTQSLPEGVSPGTRRRIGEWLGHRTKTSQW